MINDSTRTAAADGEPGTLDVITGEPRVDEALGRLAGLGELPDSGHVEAYEHVYQRLHGLLAELDTAAPTAPSTIDTAAHDRPVPRNPHDHSDGQAEQA